MPLSNRQRYKLYFNRPTLSGTPQPVSAGSAAGSAILASGSTALAASTGNAQQVALTLPALGASAIGVASAAGVGWATAAIPFIGPIVAGVTLGLGLLFSRKSGKQKVAATKIVDEAEPLLAENVEGYLANPTPEAQIQALGNFDYVWSQITSPDYCGNPALGSAGIRCIAERQRGGVNTWGADWFRLYRDPIANTPPTKVSANSDSYPNSLVSTVKGVIQTTNPDGTTSTNPIAIAAGLSIAAALILSLGRS